MYIRKIPTKKKGTMYQCDVCTNHQRFSKRFSRKVDAEMWAKQLELKKHETDFGEIKNKKMTFHEIASKWIAKHAEMKKAKSSVIKDKQILRQYLFPRFGKFDFRSISPEMIDDHIVYIKEIIQLSNSSVNQHLALMKTIFNYAIKRRYARYNPVMAVDMLPLNQKEVEWWTLKDVEKFLNYQKDKKHYLRYLVGVNTGLRPGELFALKWSAIDFSNRLISIKRTYEHSTNSIKETTKGKKIRHIGINESIFEPLLEAFKANGNKYELVFGNELDRAISQTSFLQQCFYKDTMRIGMKKITFHAFCRHTFATNYIINGGRIEDLQNILGHSDLKTTMKYIHLSKNYLRDKMDVVNFSPTEDIQSQNIINLEDVRKVNQGL
ncbi:MAG: tyrosine-type recombinase/integrase [Pseudomonadota bacterium]